MKRWFAVYTHPNAEDRARQHLERQGFATYLPRYLKPRRHARQSDIVPAPLFPRYLFVEVDPENQRWQAIQSTVGVSHLVRQGDQPAPVSEIIIAGIRSREDEQGWVSLDGRPPLRKGDPVQITAGPFSDLKAIFQCRADRDRVMVLLHLLGRAVAVRVPTETLEAVE